MSATPFRVQFDLTFEDLQQAYAAAQAAAVQRQQRQLKKSKTPLVVAVVAGVCIFLVLTLSAIIEVDEFHYLRPPFYILITLLFPVLVLSIFAFIIVRYQAPQHPTERARKAASQLLLSVLPWVVLLGLMLWVHWLAEYRSFAYGDWFGTLFPHFPWIIATAILATMTMNAARIQIRQFWDQHPMFHRPKTIEIRMNGISFLDAVEARQYDWLAFVRFEETKTLFLLYTGNMSFEIIPKRAFATGADLDAARGIFTSQIHDADALPYAFPVLPAAHASQPAAGSDAGIDS